MHKIQVSQMLLGRGVYSYSDASRLTGLRSARVREWFSARPESKLRAIFKSDFSGATTENLISFLDLVDVFVAGNLREHGLSLQTLRRVYTTLQQDYSLSHPFGRRELLTDGTRIFLAGLDREGKDEVVEVLTRQRVFPEIIRPFLKQLMFDRSSNLAASWNIAKGVVVDPAICFGKPIVEGKGVPTYLIAKAVTANGNDRDIVADWYGMTTAQVANACRFETHRAA